MAKRIHEKKCNELDDAQKTLLITNEAIRSGCERLYASTGTPMEKLSGGAKFMAIYSNIGGSSIKSGGGGVKRGQEIIALNVYARTRLKNEASIRKRILSK